MIATAGTFDYLAIVPEDRGEGGFECRAETRGAVVRSGSDLEDNRLVGISPLVRVTDAGPSSDAGLRPPWSLRKRSRVTLVATERERAVVAEASFHIDKTFTDCARAGDRMHLVRDEGGGLGFSLIRGGKLLAAAGALTAVPLGQGAEVRIPQDVLSAADAVFQARDPDFEFDELPVEIKIDGLREGTNSSRNVFISFGGGEVIGDYRVLVRHGAFTIEDGPSESVAICHEKMFTHAAGEFAALLLDDPKGLSLSEWPEEGD